MRKILIQKILNICLLVRIHVLVHSFFEYISLFLLEFLIRSMCKWLNFYTPAFSFSKPLSRFSSSLLILPFEIFSEKTFIRSIRSFLSFPSFHFPSSLLRKNFKSVSYCDITLSIFPVFKFTSLYLHMEISFQTAWLFRSQFFFHYHKILSCTFF